MCGNKYPDVSLCLKKKQLIKLKNLDHCALWILKLDLEGIRHQENHRPRNVDLKASSKGQLEGLEEKLVGQEQRYRVMVSDTEGMAAQVIQRKIAKYEHWKRREKIVANIESEFEEKCRVGRSACGMDKTTSIIRKVG